MSKVKHAKCKYSASLAPNNLQMGNKWFAFLDHNNLNVIKHDTTSLESERISSQSISASDWGKQTVSQLAVLQMAIGQVVVLVTFGGGIRVYDGRSIEKIHEHQLPEASGNHNNLYGIAGDGKDTLFIGTGSGDIVAFECGKKFGFRMKLEGHKAAVRALAYSNDTLISGDGDGSVMFWADGERGKTVSGKGSPCICLHARGDHAVAGFGSGHIRMFGVANQSIECEVAAHTNTVNAVCIHPSKPVVACASDDTFVSVWSLPSSVKCVFHISPSGSLLTGVAWNPAGKLVCNAYDSRFVSSMQID